MLQDFLSNRPDAPVRSGAFQPLVASRTAGLGRGNSEPAADAASSQLEAPEIELVRENGQVRRIVVTCTCCEKITIDCEY